MKYLLKTSLFSVAIIAENIFWLILIAVIFYTLGYYSFNRQGIYDTGVKDGQKIQLQQDEMLYKKVEQLDKELLWKK